MATVQLRIQTPNLRIFSSTSLINIAIEIWDQQKLWS